MALLVRTDGMAAVDNSQNQNKAQTQAQTQAQTVPAAAKDDSTVTASTAAKPTARETNVTGESATVAKRGQGLGISAVGNGVDFSALNAEYEGKYDQQLADLYNQIVQRKPFSYSSSDDAFYQQYVDRYTKGGQMAMMDSMGQAAALTGGYGNSYAQRVGQQTYDEYMTGLNDRALELEERAYGRYQDQGAALSQHYAMLGDIADTDYARFMDRYNMAGDQYDRYLTEAAMRAEQGDFDAYARLYGEDAAKRMQSTWAAVNLMPLYTAGQMDAETYKSIAGVYPVGYDPNAPAQAAAVGGMYGTPYSARESAYARGQGDAYEILVSEGATPAEAYKAIFGNPYYSV